MINSDVTKIGDGLVDGDGDEWVLREDGWCCQVLCEHDGVMVRHSCDEHSHFPLSHLERNFGPLTFAGGDPQS